MENKILEGLKENNNVTLTENGGRAYKSTLNKVYDMFAFGGAYRNRNVEDKILLFKNAFEEDASLALKCLFYLRDIRGGQGERDFFRVCFQWLSKEYPTTAKELLKQIPEYGRWDDLIYSTINTPLEKDMAKIIREQIELDLNSINKSQYECISLLGKWLPSENASSILTKATANTIRKYLGLSHKSYRKMLTKLRKRINIIESLMSRNEWDKIEFDKIPSKAGFIYKNAFARQLPEQYKNFIENKDTKVKTTTLYPYEIVRAITNQIKSYTYTSLQGEIKITEEQRKVLNKYWENQKDYLEGKNSNLICVVDTSSSMTYARENNVKPIDVAISLGMYAGERLNGVFKNNFISFSSMPKLIEIEGIDFVDKVCRIYKQNLCQNTNLRAVFDLLRDIALTKNAKEDLPKTIVVISDMEIDTGSYWRTSYSRESEMEQIRNEWASVGLEMPRLIYWNVNARHNLILDKAENISFVSGCSPIIFESILKGKNGWELCLDKLLSDRYNQIG